MTDRHSDRNEYYEEIKAGKGVDSAVGGGTSLRNNVDKKDKMVTFEQKCK